LFDCRNATVITDEFGGEDCLNAIASVQSSVRDLPSLKYFRGEEKFLRQLCNGLLWNGRTVTILSRS